MTSKNVARTAKGNFAARGHKTEAKQRDLGRYPTTAHDGRRSIGSCTGTTRLDTGRQK
jgi:hypothetical protein